MEVTQLVGDVGQGVLHGFADGALAITDDRLNGYTESPLHLAQERGQVFVACGQQALGQQDFAGEAITEDPEDFMAHVGLQAIERQDDPTLRFRQTPEASGVLERQAEQFIIALQEIRDRALGDNNTPVDQGLMDFGNAAVLRIASVAHKGDDIKAELVLG
jgi:hypothetical protein